MSSPHSLQAGAAFTWRPVRARRSWGPPEPVASAVEPRVCDAPATAARGKAGLVTGPVLSGKRLESSCSCTVPLRCTRELRGLKPKARSRFAYYTATMAAAAVTATTATATPTTKTTTTIFRPGGRRTRLCVRAGATMERLLGPSVGPCATAPWPRPSWPARCESVTAMAATKLACPLRIRDKQHGDKPGAARAPWPREGKPIPIFAD